MIFHNRANLPLDDPTGIEIVQDDLQMLAERFAAYQAALGENFVAQVLPDSAAKRDELPPFFAEVVACPHSVVTAHLVDQAGQPTLAARDQIMAYFQRCLLPSN